MLVQRQEQRQSAGPEERDAMPQHENQHESTIEIQTLACKVTRVVMLC